jgi:hypothetical protein
MVLADGRLLLAQARKNLRTVDGARKHDDTGRVGLDTMSKQAKTIWAK